MPQSELLLHVIGSSHGIPFPGNPTSGYLVVYEGFGLMLDIGAGVTGELVARNLWDSVNAATLSHAHHDHATGIYESGLWHMYHSPQGYNPETGSKHLFQPRVGGALTPAELGSHGEARSTQEMAIAVANDPGFPVQPAALWSPETVDASETRQTRTVGPVTVEFWEGVHTVPSNVVRITTPTGEVLVYTGDTGPTERLPEFAEGADLLLCEATYPAGRSKGVNHLTTSEAGRYAKQAGVKALVITHLGRNLDQNQALVEAREAYGEPTWVAVPRTPPFRIVHGEQVVNRVSATLSPMAITQRLPVPVTPTVPSRVRSAFTQSLLRQPRSSVSGR